MTTSATRLVRRGVRAAPAALLLALLAQGVLAQGNLGFLRDTPFAHFRGNDSKLMREAGLAVLKDAKPGNSQTWQNPETGASGTITLDRMFTGSNGRPCGVVRVESRTRQVSGVTTMTLCQRPDGQWQLATEQGPN